MEPRRESDGALAFQPAGAAVLAFGSDGGYGSPLVRLEQHSWRSTRPIIRTAGAIR